MADAPSPPTPPSSTGGDAPNQKLLLAGFALAFVGVALVLFFMLRGGAEDAAHAPPGTAEGQRPAFNNSPTFQRPTLPRKLPKEAPPPTEEAQPTQEPPPSR